MSDHLQAACAAYWAKGYIGSLVEAIDSGAVNDLEPVRRQLGEVLAHLRRETDES